jgi:hypothetical protein
MYVSVSGESLSEVWYSGKVHNAALYLSAISELWDRIPLLVCINLLYPFI